MSSSSNERPPTPGTPLSATSSNTRIAPLNTPEEFSEHLDKLLECPVCLEVILPPVVTCVQGHSVCSSCRAGVVNCPVCRANFSSVRNLFADQLLERCRVTCKFGCGVNLPARDLSTHHTTACPFRPVYCRECDQLIPFADFIPHVERVDKLERQDASECSTGFEIDEQDLASFTTPLLLQPQFGGGGVGGGRRATVWEPTWMHCYRNDFFCSLDFNGAQWWVWVSSLQEEATRKFKTQIILWNKAKGIETTYFGSIHSHRKSADEVLCSGECLILTDSTLASFMNEGGIDVLVRIEREYNPPRTRRGEQVKSPLEVHRENVANGSSSSNNNEGQDQGQGDASSALSSTVEQISRRRSTVSSGGAGESRIPLLRQDDHHHPISTSPVSSRRLFGGAASQRFLRRGRGSPVVGGGASEGVENGGNSGVGSGVRSRTTRASPLHRRFTRLSNIQASPNTSTSDNNENQNEE